MPDWGKVADEIRHFENPLNVVRKKYANILYGYTGRNVISYYSAFLQRPSLPNVGIDDNDKNAFMQAIHGLDRSKGLDLILHTPGGQVNATESLVNYLREMFGYDIRVIVPQIAMSAGTMIALSAKEIVMGKESNLGPIDPQLGPYSCAAIIEEFNEAIEAIKEDPISAQVWGIIINKYPPTLYGECKKNMELAKDIAINWLKDNMLKDNPNKADDVVKALCNHEDTYSHSRHIHMDELKRIGLKIVQLENLNNNSKGNCKDLQDCVLTLHHAYMHTLSDANISKIIENHKGVGMITTCTRTKG